MEQFDNPEQHNTPEQRDDIEQRLEHLRVQIEYLTKTVAYMEEADLEEAQRVFFSVYSHLTTETAREEGVDVDDKESIIATVKADIAEAKKERREIEEEKE